MSSETSTDVRRDDDASLQPRHLYILLSMVGATVAVVVVGRGHPVALILLSLTIVAAGFVGLAMQGALAGFFGVRAGDEPVRSVRETDTLEREKALVLRSIKELEFDRAMGKVADADFTQLNTALRARAVALMQSLEAEQGSAGAGVKAKSAPACRSCGTVNDTDARFCKSCGARM